MFKSYFRWFDYLPFGFSGTVSCLVGIFSISLHTLTVISTRGSNSLRFISSNSVTK